MELGQICQQQKTIVFPENRSYVKKDTKKVWVEYGDDKRMISCNIDPTYISCSPPESTFMMNLKKRLNEY